MNHAESSGRVAASASSGTPTADASRRSTAHTGGSDASGRSASAGVTGEGQDHARAASWTSASASRASCRSRWARADAPRARPWDQAYPPSSASWKNSWQVVHSAELPPNQGSSRFASTSWIENSRSAPSPTVAAKTTVQAARDGGPGTGRAGVVCGSLTVGPNLICFHDRRPDRPSRPRLQGLQGRRPVPPRSARDERRAAGGRDRGDPRAQRQRQEHAAQPDRRHRRPQLGRGVGGRARAWAGCRRRRARCSAATSSASCSSSST